MRSATSWEKEWAEEAVQDFVLAHNAFHQEQSLRSLEKKLANESKKTYLWSFLIRGYLAQGERSAAIAALEQARRNLPKVYSTTNSNIGSGHYDELAEFYEELGELSKARKIYRQGMRVFPEKTYQYKNLCAGLARLQFESGNYEDTIYLLENKYLKDSAGDVLIYWMLALAYLYQGRSNDARETFLVGCHHGLAKVLTLAVNNTRGGWEYKCLSSHKRKAGTNELVNLFSTTEQRPQLLLACCEFATGHYSAASRLLERLLVTRKSNIAKADRILAKEMFRWAMARNYLASEDAIRARRFYLKAAADTPDKFRRTSFCLIADVIQWDKTFESLFRGPQQATNLPELQNRLLILSRKLRTLMGPPQSPMSRVFGLPIGAPNEQSWCEIKSECIGALVDVLNFKSSAATREQWRHAQRLLTMIGLKNVCDAIGAMELFAVRFEQLASQNQWDHLDAFPADQQKILLEVLSPAAALDGVWTSQATDPTRDIKRLLAKADELFAQIQNIIPKNTPAYPFGDTCVISVAPDRRGELTLTTPQGLQTTIALTIREAELWRQLAEQSKQDEEKRIPASFVGYKKWQDIASHKGTLFTSIGDQPGLIRDTARKVRAKLKHAGYSPNLLASRKGHGYRLALHPANVVIQIAPNQIAT